MRKTIIALGVVAVGVASAWMLLLPDLFSARAKPSQIEASIARALRSRSIPRTIRELENPVAATPQVLAEGRTHFADHCAVCHANDGSGKTSMGPHFYPPAPDMRQRDTQSLSDGELFYAIQNGIRFTGMPAFGSGSPEDERASWELVHFIRHLPEITKAEIREMEKMNPKSHTDREEEDEMNQFLGGH